MKNKKVKASNYRETLIWTLIVAILFAELFVYTWCRVQCTSIGYEIVEIADSYDELTALKQNLNIELATLKSLERVGQIAKKQFELAPPNPDQIILVY